ncbi:Lrp/AsnC family transcriptional regulator [Actinocorallia aurea]
MPKPLYDRVDREILAVLQREGRLQNVELAERVRLSPSACLRRTKALEEDGVLAGYRAELDRERLGLGLTVFVSLKVDQHSRETSRHIEEALMALPSVIAVHAISGDADFLAEVAVPDLAAYERVLLDGILAIGPVREARSAFSIRSPLRRGPLPVEDWRAGHG